jgi:predicted DNA-binding transcriptional regulator YafY
MLLLLQNRGRLTSAALARELEVTPRTILRDVDALTEAGLPVIVHQGNQGGIELGFNYRTRLTGLATDEAEALAIILARVPPEIGDLGMSDAAKRARVKLLESFPDAIRATMETTRERFMIDPTKTGSVDPRVAALAEAIRRARIVRINVGKQASREIHPVRLVLDARGWSVVDGLNAAARTLVSDCGDINVSARTFEPGFIKTGCGKRKRQTSRH